MKLILMGCLLLSACGLKKEHETKVVIPNISIAQKAELYCDLQKPVYEETKFIHSKCDGLLFTSLFSLSCDYVDIDVFEKENGLWKRSPTHDCFAKKESRSGLSRDMLIGLVFHAYQFERLDILERLIEYGEENSWQVCAGEYDSEAMRIGRCKVTSNLKAAIYDVAVSLGYKCSTSCKVARAFTQVWNPLAGGYEAHLITLQILLRGFNDGAINQYQIDFLKKQIERQPKNALFEAAHAVFTDGDMSRAALLLTTEYFPEDRLPASSDRCEDYLWQRDYGKNWEPCNELKMHSAGDYQLVASLINGKIRGHLRLLNRLMP